MKSMKLAKKFLSAFLTLALAHEPVIACAIIPRKANLDSEAVPKISAITFDECALSLSPESGHRSKPGFGPLVGQTHTALNRPEDDPERVNEATILVINKFLIEEQRTIDDQSEKSVSWHPFGPDSRLPNRFLSGRFMAPSTGRLLSNLKGLGGSHDNTTTETLMFVIRISQSLLPNDKSAWMGLLP
jgi:hypothetical protein